MGEMERWILDQTRIDETEVDDLVERYTQKFGILPNSGRATFARYVLYRNLRAWREGKTEEVRGEPDEPMIAALQKKVADLEETIQQFRGRYVETTNRAEFQIRDLNIAANQHAQRLTDLETKVEDLLTRTQREVIGDLIARIDRLTERIGLLETKGTIVFRDQK